MTARPASGAGHSLKGWVRALERTAPITRNPSVTFPALIQTLADKFGDAVALVSEHESLTYRELGKRANRYARWALGQGLAAGDVVCLLMPNCPEYLAIWLGLARIGAIVSLVNTNLAGEPLAHSINTVAPARIIVGAELGGAAAAVLPRLSAEAKCWMHGQGQHGFARIDQEIERVAEDRLDAAECQPPSIMDPALYIYTSGTTGLPKAAKVSHLRVMQWSHWFAGMMDTRPDDIMYNCLPMYHSVGGVVAPGAMLVSGGAVVLRRRFSASHFWDDLAESNCTIFQYIGELCRYLVNSPPHPRETAHRLRLCCGNGLRPEIWDQFKRRFRISQILEFYASTEGNFSLYNCEGKPGAIGHIPSFLAHRFPVALIEFDIESGEPLRGENGFCIRSAVNEIGEAIGQILDDHPGSAGRFEGYTDNAASGSKILRDVFVKGDTWYRTGDLMRRDEKGYFYFVDRAGDTFRWKGENVSTAEVADAITAFPGVVEAVVYGVTVPGTEGRAGMGAVVVSGQFDLAAFRLHLEKCLPDYARPRFLRIRGEIEMTSTFKPKKQNLSREGYDPGIIADALYFDDRVSRTFVKLDAALYERIVNRKLRL